MYAIASVSSSAYQIARVTNEVESQARSITPPQPAQSHYNQQGSQGQSIAATSTVQAPAPSVPSFNIAAKASQLATVHKVPNSSGTQRQKLSAPQQDRVNQFNLEMINQSPQNATSRIQSNVSTQNNNVQAAQKPSATSSALTESPYLIVVLNQNVANMQKADATTSPKPPDKPPSSSEVKKL
ncbi:MAG: hypothetical protein OCD03_14180 [Hyphomicrobiales bacterium]